MTGKAVDAEVVKMMVDSLNGEIKKLQVQVSDLEKELEETKKRVRPSLRNMEVCRDNDGQTVLYAGDTPAVKIKVGEMLD